MNRKVNKLILAAFLLLATVHLACAEDAAVNPAAPRQCYSCQGINCQRTTKLNVTTQCTDLLDICVTVFEGFAVTAKGCYLDMAEMYRSKCDERNSSPECFKCFGQLCNNKGRADFKCIACNSKDNSKCATDTTDMQPVQCSIPTAPNSYCYVRNSGANSVTRGCFVHLQEQQQCMTDRTCSLCLSDDGEACNSYKLDSAATADAAGVAVLSVGAVLTLIVNFLR